MVMRDLSNGYEIKIFNSIRTNVIETKKKNQYNSSLNKNQSVYNLKGKSSSKL